MRVPRKVNIDRRYEHLSGVCSEEIEELPVTLDGGFNGSVGTPMLEI